jgi:hypothetical protein
LKKPTGSVRFRFFKPGTGKTELNRTEPEKNRAKPKKPSQTEPKPSQTGKTEPNRFEPVFSLKNRTEPKPVGLNRFRFGFGFFFKKKNFGLVTFFDKNRTEPNREHP